MKVTQLPYEKIGFISKIILDYIDQKGSIQSYFTNFPNLEGFEKQIKEKEKSFNQKNRIILSQTIDSQYKGLNISEKTKGNITLLKEPNTYTVTTGHQLNLFTGPLYFLYKIFSTINLAEELAEKFPDKNIIPIFWMATEDHDFEEINFFNFQNKKIKWEHKDGGAVGRFKTNGLEGVFEEFSTSLGSSKNADKLKNLFSKGYLENESLADATRYIANEMFKEYGLVIIDGDNKDLKKLFIPNIKDELEHQTSFNAVSKTISSLEKNYKIQVKPREINLFYLGDSSRERILFENNVYKIKNTNKTFSKESILKEVTENPLAFSPNVIMRPLYQESILPNICYVGGGGELAYWLELKEYFKKSEVSFPVLLLRNAVQIISKKQQNKLNKLEISHEELFLNSHILLSKKVIENSKIELDFKLKIAFLKNQFIELRQIAEKTDFSFTGAVNAQERKQIKGLESLQKKLLNAEKKRQKNLVNRVTELQNQLVPNENLEERQRNFSEYYLEYGGTFLTDLKTALKPLDLDFTILEI